MVAILGCVAADGIVAVESGLPGSPCPGRLLGPGDHQPSLRAVEDPAPPPLLLTPNALRLPSAKWPTVFGDAKMNHGAARSASRITCEIVETGNESWRFQEPRLIRVCPASAT